MAQNERPNYLFEQQFNVKCFCNPTKAGVFSDCLL
jgi:hypothetical protein